MPPVSRRQVRTIFLHSEKVFTIGGPMEKIEVTCEMEVTLKMIGGKCKPLILEHLITHGTQRFSQIQRQLPQVSQRTLTNQLRELEADGLLTRQVYPQVPPRVEYTITPKGQSLSEILELMCA